MYNNTAQVTEAQLGHSQQPLTMFRLTLRYARYAVSALATVGFSIN
jgi:hypothetical protein